MLSASMLHIANFSSAHDDVEKKLENVPQQAYDGGSSFIKGIGESFGYCPDDYHYSFEVWNDTPQQLFITAQKILNIQGASFDSEVAASATINPYSSTQDTFYNKQLCHLSVWLCTGKEQCKIGYKGRVTVSQNELSQNTFFYKKIDVTEKDSTIYYFHIYTEQGVPKGEFIGPGLLAGPLGTSSEFDGVLYNKSTIPARLRFIKDTHSYTVTLEPNTWSLLSSTSTVPYSIRPKTTGQNSFTFTFDANTSIDIPLASTGLAYIFKDPQTQQTTTLPATYTYALYQDTHNKPGIDIQGICLGNYDQPGVQFQAAKVALFGTKASYTYPDVKRVRDINPATCFIWYQSAQQVLQSSTEKNMVVPENFIPYEPPEQVWLSYVTKDYTLQQKLRPGIITPFLLIRPQLQEKEAQLYVVAFSAGEEKNIALFLHRLHAGIIGKEATYNPITHPFSLSSDLLTTLSPNLSGSINDTTGKEASGITGTILLVDTFTPRGMGTGPFYYSLQPALLQINEAFIATISSTLDPQLVKNSTDQQTIVREIKTKLPEWIRQYAQQQSSITTYGITKQNYQQPSLFARLQSLVPDLTSYLKQKGAKEMFVNPTTTGDARLFNDRGKQTLYALLFGPLSISNPPLLRQSGTSYAVLGEKPSTWPTA
jgi:hypothetical protein